MSWIWKANLILLQSSCGNDKWREEDSFWVLSTILNKSLKASWMTWESSSQKKFSNSSNKSHKALSALDPLPLKNKTLHNLPPLCCAHGRSLHPTNCKKWQLSAYATDLKAFCPRPSFLSWTQSLTDRISDFYLMCQWSQQKHFHSHQRPCWVNPWSAGLGLWPLIREASSCLNWLVIGRIPWYHNDAVNPNTPFSRVALSIC